MALLIKKHIIFMWFLYIQVINKKILNIVEGNLIY
jgi:hypothetical protein